MMVHSASRAAIAQLRRAARTRCCPRSPVRAVSGSWPNELYSASAPARFPAAAAPHPGRPGHRRLRRVRSWPSSSSAASSSASAVNLVELRGRAALVLTVGSGRQPGDHGRRRAAVGGRAAGRARRGRGRAVPLRAHPRARSGELVSALDEQAVPAERRQALLTVGAGRQGQPDHRPNCSTTRSAATARPVCCWPSTICSRPAPPAGNVRWPGSVGHRADRRAVRAGWRAR